MLLGLGWLRAATAKSLDPSWWNGTEIERFLLAHTEATLPWYQPFINLVVAPNAVVFSAIVLVLEFAAALMLLSGRLRSTGLAIGIVLNLHFLAAGAVNPSAFYLLAQGALALWLFEQRPSTDGAPEIRLVLGLSTAIVGLNLPFIRTLHPNAVVDDPAIMMATVGGLTCLACLLVADRVPAREQQEVLSRH